MIIQLRWSDEEVWKKLRPVDPKRPIDDQLAELRAEWLREKNRYKLKYDMELRVVEET